MSEPKDLVLANEQLRRSNRRWKALALGRLRRLDPHRNGKRHGARPGHGSKPWGPRRRSERLGSPHSTPRMQRVPGGRGDADADSTPVARLEFLSRLCELTTPIERIKDKFAFWLAHQARNDPRAATLSFTPVVKDEVR